MMGFKIQALARRRFSSSLHPVNSIKHILDAFGQLSNTRTTVPFVVAVPNVDSAVFKPGDVRVGAHVNGFFIETFIIGSTGGAVVGPIDWYIAKLHAGQSVTNPFPAPGATGVSSVRNQIIHEEKGLIGSGDGTAMAFKGVIKVPKSMRRMREGDQWFISYRSEDNTSNPEFCFKAIYKSYF